ncbi:anti-sigma factor RsiW [Herbaspirillum sp. Sphag1AN]|uniref:anti-sigma factor family protein n=1 Tax=unclassified Herbaspirillum TaxID=2624150 RepID=UPI0016192AA3|nr:MULTISPECIES: anti-sigma factor [unclassified Herbaspirillum]MBB3214284.1 anti-sigma factor RsiW [Herbaspirillum sp. Sphag1AN]MBB3247336.1 anti-sigma factor RsiW [Herbaspirillum sp. Sphag64]
MNCEECQQTMQAALDGALDAATSKLHAQHLGSCPACQDAQNDLLGVRRMVRAHASRHSAPAALRLRVVNDVTQATASVAPAVTPATFVEQLWTRLQNWPWARINFGFASTASLAFAVVLSLYIGMPSEQDRIDQEIVATHFRSLQLDHLADVVSTDKHTVKPWFSGKLDFSPPVFDLALQNFPLIGGRLDYFDQHAAAAMVYRHDKHLINLFVWPEKAAQRSKLSSTHGFQLLRWSDGEMAYAAISDLNGPELQQFQHLLITEMAK